MLKTLVVSKLNDEGDRDSLRASQGKAKLKKQLRLVDRTEPAVQHSQGGKEELQQEQFDPQRPENLQEGQNVQPRAQEERSNK